MFSARIITWFILTLSILAVAAPVTHEVEKRQSDSLNTVASLLASLQETVSSATGQLNGLLSSGTLSDNAAIPLVSELTSALTSTSGILSGLQAVTTTGSAAPEIAELASTAAGIISAITVTSDSLLKQSQSIPVAGVLLTGVDAAVNELLLGLNLTIIGILASISALLNNLNALSILKAINFTSTLTTLLGAL